MNYMQSGAIKKGYVTKHIAFDEAIFTLRQNNTTQIKHKSILNNGEDFQ